MLTYQEVGCGVSLVYAAFACDCTRHAKHALGGRCLASVDVGNNLKKCQPNRLAINAHLEICIRYGVAVGCRAVALSKRDSNGSKDLGIRRGGETLYILQRCEAHVAMPPLMPANATLV